MNRIKQCYLCNNKETRIIQKGTRTNKNINVRKCFKCGFVFIDAHIINETFYEENGLSKDIVIDTMDKTDTQRRTEYFRNLFSGKKILDFGCGKGSFLFSLRNNNITTYLSALEINKKYDKKLFSNFIYYNQLREVPDNTYDYITLFHTLEHFEKPAELLSEIVLKLNDTGEIIIEIPNVNDVLLTTYNCEAYKKFFYTIWHYYYFNEISIRKLIKKARLELVSCIGIQRYPLINHLYWLIYGKPGGHTISSFFNNNTFNPFYEMELRTKKQTDTLLVTVKKR